VGGFDICTGKDGVYYKEAMYIMKDGLGGREGTPQQDYNDDDGDDDDVSIPIPLYIRCLSL
jgi:hypothetical protein